jgi:hypothetical protein
MQDQNARENYTRVTKILYPFSGLQNIDSDVVANAARRGTKVHKICEGIASGLGEIGVDDEALPYVESFKKWWGDGKDTVFIEQRFWDDELQITGAVDFIISTSHGNIIVDLKTSSRPSKTWQPQGCAYALLARKSGIPISKIHFVHLSKMGKVPKIHEYEPDDLLFLSILKTYNHFYKEAA